MLCASRVSQLAIVWLDVSMQLLDVFVLSLFACACSSFQTGQQTDCIKSHHFIPCHLFSSANKSEGGSSANRSMCVIKHDLILLLARLYPCKSSAVTPHHATKISRTAELASYQSHATARERIFHTRAATHTNISKLHENVHTVCDMFRRCNNKH